MRGANEEVSPFSFLDPIPFFSLFLFSLFSLCRRFFIFCFCFFICSCCRETSLFVLLFFFFALYKSVFVFWCFFFFHGRLSLSLHLK